jgi:hypothetical protein
MHRALGPGGAALVSVLIVVSAATSANAAVFTGARMLYAFGRDFPLFGRLGRWHPQARTPANALVLQGALALVLVVLGATTRRGFETMVEYTAPVFWLFFFLVGASLFVRARSACRSTPSRRSSSAARARTCCTRASSTPAWVRSSASRSSPPAAWCSRWPGHAPRSRVHGRSPGGERMRFPKVTMPLTLALVLSAVIATAVAQTTTAPKPLDVPYVPTDEKVVAQMLSVAKVGKKDVLYDLGSGDGRIVITAAKKFGTRGVGIDIDPDRIKEANDNAREAGVTNLVKFIQGDIFDADIKEATVVTMYLLPAINMKLRPKLLSDLKPGTRIVSHNYDLGDWKPEKKLTVTVGSTEHLVYFWKVPARAAQDR